MLKDGTGSERILEKIQTPGAVQEVLTSFADLTPHERTGIENRLKLSYLFGGFDVACKATDAGTLIVASGPGDEVAARLAELSEIDFAGVYVERPPTWNTLVRASSHSTTRSR